jgi:hypothetical protein
MHRTPRERAQHNHHCVGEPCAITVHRTFPAGFHTMSNGVKQWLHLLESIREIRRLGCIVVVEALVRHLRCFRCGFLEACSEIRTYYRVSI